MNRIVAKTFSWSLLAFGLTALVSYIFTDSILVATGIGLTDRFIKIIAYFIHELAWKQK